MRRLAGDGRSQPERPYRLLFFALVTVALVAGACGDDSDDTRAAAVDTAEETADGSTDNAEPATDTAESDDGESDAGTGSGEAVVEIGDERWTFAMDLGCQQMFGGLGGGGTAADGSGVQFEALIPPEDYESKPDENWAPPKVRVVLADGSSWTAASQEGQGSVGSFANDGERTSGQATFRHDGGDTSEGSFEFSCP